MASVLARMLALVAQWYSNMGRSSRGSFGNGGLRSIHSHYADQVFFQISNGQRANCDVKLVCSLIQIWSNAREPTPNITAYDFKVTRSTQAQQTRLQLSSYSQANTT